jgi:hypothetical protein
MALVGYEQDQVMVSPRGQPGANPEHDVSVPINWAYNHVSFRSFRVPLLHAALGKRRVCCCVDLQDMFHDGCGEWRCWCSFQALVANLLQLSLIYIAMFAPLTVPCEVPQHPPNLTRG